MSEIERAPCSICGGRTKHTVLATRDVDELENDPEDGDFSIARNRFALLECCGCESVRLRHTYEWFPDNQSTTTFFPPHLSRRHPKWISALPKNLTALLQEIYSALASDSRCLSTMGARTVVDMVMDDKVGDIGSFKTKLEALEAQGVISRLNREYLATALDAGSAAAHRGHVPSVAEVEQVMDIVENLLDAVYILPKAAEELKKLTPMRKKNNDAKPAV